MRKLAWNERSIETSVKSNTTTRLYFRQFSAAWNIGSDVQI